MESWCFDSLNKGFMSNGSISTSDSIIKDKSELMSCELKHPFSYDNSVLVPSHQSAHNSYFPELGIAEMISRQIPHEMNRNVLGDNASVGDVVSPSLVTSNVNSGDEESSSKFSSSVMDSNSRESSLVDLKLGGIGDKPKSNSASTVNVMSSADSSTPTKRARVSSLNSQTAYCQVYGCHKDLSSAKGYHRRHKVCDAHSKTPIVVVKGVEQRFCQQCSRFHLLGEFDDSKRSCRKRLAGHNERRRKPQLGFSGRSGKSFHSYSGSNFQEFTPRSTSYIFQDRGTSHANDWVKQIKMEDGTGCAQKPAYNCIDGQLQPKSVSPSQIMEKQFPFTDNTNNNGLPSDLGKNVAQYTSQTVSHSLFQTNPLGSEDLTLTAASTIEGLQGITESGCALSLLSSQSRNSFGHSPRMPGIHLSIMPNNSPYYSGNEVSEKLFGVQNRYSMGSNQPSSMFMQNDSDTARSDFGNVMHLDSNSLNIKDQLSSKDGTTIDLLQLSSQLQRMENQRRIASDKQETEDFCCLKIK